MSRTDVPAAPTIGRDGTGATPLLRKALHSRYIQNPRGGRVVRGRVIPFTTPRRVLAENPTLQNPETEITQKTITDQTSKINEETGNQPMVEETKQPEIPSTRGRYVTPIFNPPSIQENVERSFGVLHVKPYPLIMISLCGDCRRESSCYSRLYSPSGKQHTTITMCQDCVFRNRMLSDSLRE